MNNPLNNPGLQIQNLQVAYGRRTVIDQLNVARLLPGEVVAVLGPNGSGKSTLLRALAGLTPSHGAVVLGEQHLERAHFAERARRVVYLPQALPAAVHLRVFESLLAARNASRPALRPAPQTQAAGQAHDARSLAAAHAHAHTNDQHSAVQAGAALLEELGIGHLAMRHLDELSGGQVQLAGLAQALIRQPEVLLLDEPLSALDLNHQFHVMELVRQHTRQQRMVTLVVLHDLGIALRHADRVLMMHSGQLLADGSPADAITPELLARVYGVQARVEPCSRGQLQVMVDGLVAAP